MDLVQISRNKVVVSSRQVADHFGKRHVEVLDKIREILVVENSTTKNMFHKTTHEYRGQQFPEYIMNRDGFSLLVMGFNGKEALQWKLKYIEAFNSMEKALTERQSVTWQEARQSGKLTRRAETDTIKELVEYAKQQGSSHPDMLYMAYSKLANKSADIVKRDEASSIQLTKLTLIEDIILQVIRLDMEQCKGYKEIYQDCKNKMNQFRDATFVGLVNKENKQ